jgi:hypothetical protein
MIAMNRPIASMAPMHGAGSRQGIEPCFQLGLGVVAVMSGAHPVSCSAPHTNWRGHLNKNKKRGRTKGILLRTQDLKLQRVLRGRLSYNASTTFPHLHKGTVSTGNVKISERD